MAVRKIAPLVPKELAKKLKIKRQHEALVLTYQRFAAAISDPTAKEEYLKLAQYHRNKADGR